MEYFEYHTGVLLLLVALLLALMTGFAVCVTAVLLKPSLMDSVKSARLLEKISIALMSLMVVAMFLIFGIALFDVIRGIARAYAAGAL